MKNRYLRILFTLGLGIALALLWSLEGGSAPAVAAPVLSTDVPSVVEGPRTMNHIESPNAPTAELHVCPSGCTYSSVQDAVDAASDGDVIKVATGTYTDVNNYDGSAQIVYITKTVTIRGGYTTAFTDPPDPEVNPTTLDAQGQGRVLYINAFDPGTSVSFMMEGLRITGGDASQGGGNGYGGGVYAIDANLTICDNQMFNNAAQDGGGLYLGGSTATLNDNTISSNTANQDGGGLYIDSNSTATLSGNTISSNTANGTGGGLRLGDNTMDISATLNGNTIISNTADTGGGLYLESMMDGGDVTLINNVVADNHANSTGSGLYIGGSYPLLMHTTIARNTGGDGSGIYIIGGDMYGTLILTNTILVSHTVGVYVGSAITARLESTLWGSGAWANVTDWSGDGTIITGTVNVWGDPVFVDPDAGDYHIGSLSDARDAGTDAGVNYDMDGEIRPMGGEYDIGADEYPHASLDLHKAAWPLTLNTGQTVTYTLDITNIGADTATNVRLTDTLPILQQTVAITTTWGSCTPGAGWGGTATCDLGTMAAGDSALITLTAQVTTAPPAQLPVLMRNTAWVEATETTSHTAYADTTLHDCHVRLNDSLTEYNTVQVAVDTSTQPTDVVKVAGVCAGVTSRAGVAQSVYLSKTLTLQGGWNTTFTQRNVISFPTTLDAWGQGRVLFITGDINPTVEGVRITGGDVDGDGGGVYINDAAATISNNQVFSNTASHTGGGLYLDNSDHATLSGNSIFANFADISGSGLVLDLSDATLTNNIIADNVGNGLHIEGSSTRLLHTTIARNTGGDGVYVTQYCPMGCIYSTVALTNTILVSQTTGIYVESGNTAGLEGTLWGSGAWANGNDWGGDGTIITGTVNLWDDPDFESPGNGDYHIGPDSAALDTGVNAGVDDDIDGEPRPQGRGYDIGADERAGASLRLHKTAWPLTINPGQTLAYTLDITSAGLETATGVWLTDTLPALQRAVSVTTTHGSCAASAGWGGTTTCDLGTIASGDSAHITLTAQVTTTPPAQLPVLMRNTAWAKAIETTSISAYVDTMLHDCHARLNDSPIEYETVQAAVDASTQPTDIVKVAGTCTGVTSRDDVTQIVYLSKTLTLQGGWNTTFTQRNVISFPTTLDAQEQGRVLYITVPAPGADISPTVEGLRITGGNAAGLGGDTACYIWCYDVDAGGGIYIITATATISNNQVLSNTAEEGGGLYLKDSDATIISNTITNGDEDGDGLHLKDSDATIINNTITNNDKVGLHMEGSDATIRGNTITNNGGGGLHLKDSDATIISNTITNNIAEDGGGLYLEGSDATIISNTITNNTTGDWGESNGGGLCLIFSNATLSGNTVISNTANGSGGGVYLGIGSDATLSDNTVISNTANGNGGGVCLEDTDNATLSGNAVIFNTANGNGGGVYMKDSGATIINNTITNNTADGGGGMYLQSSGPTIRGNTITNNTSNSECGGLYLNSSNTTVTNNIVADNQANAGGSGLCIRGSSIYLLHNTVARNSGGDGSGIQVDGTVALTNTILVSHTVGVHVTEGSTATLEGTSWGSGSWANGSDWDGDGDIITGTVNLWGDPDFVDPDNGDYHIGGGSVAIDAAVDAGVTDDMDGDPRPTAFGYDIGADERTGASLRLHKAAWPSGLNTGQTFTYTLVITDVGAYTATHVQLTDTLPALQHAVAITSSQGSCAVGTGWGGVSTCDLGTLAPGYSAHVTLTAQVTTTPPVQLPWLMRNTAWVTATETTSHTAYADTSICHVRLNDSPIEYGSIQAAVDASTQPGDIVKVAGYCTGVTSRAGVAQIVYVDKTLTLQGGWNTTFMQRNPISFPTTLDAQGQGRVLYITAPAPGAGISPTVEGLRITGGDADGLGGGPHEWEHAGGGVYVISATAIIRDNQVFNNTAIFFGGGLYLRSSDATLNGNTVTSNTTSNQYVGGGGGLYLEDCVATLQGNTVSTNTATGQSSDGGGLFLDDGTVTLNENTISSNTSNGHGGGVYGEGTLIGNTVISNTAYGNGGGVHGGGTLIGNIISGNTAQGSGGGVCGGASLSGNTITGNTADQGGGLFLEGGDATLTNNVIADNQANNNGSGLYIQSASARLLHTTIARNTGDDGSGVHVDSGSAVLTNTILVSHTVGVRVTDNSTATLEGTLWGSGIWANGSDWDGDGDIITGTVNLWGDPDFVNPNAGDYHITIDSAAVDAGVDAGVPDDIDGDLRTDGYPDIGADELSVSALVVTKQATPDPVQSGAQLTYTIRVTNTGGVTLTATVADTLPDDITQGETSGGTVILPGKVVTWTPISIAPEEVWTETVVVTVVMGYAGPLTNVVEVTTEEGAAGTYTETSTVLFTPPNQAPYTPTNPIPADGASGVPITQTLSWQGGDPDIGDTVTYTIAISAGGQPPVVDTTTLTSYTPSLIASTTYYWVVTTTDGISTTIGPTWSFTTAVSAPSNQAPYTPTNPIPNDGASNAPITQTLSWEGGDPDAGDTVTYTIAISTSGQPPVVDTTLLTSYAPSLVTNTTYYWIITATDGISTTVGPMWRFTTVGFKYIYLPLVLRNY